MRTRHRIATAAIAAVWLALAALASAPLAALASAPLAALASAPLAALASAPLAALASAPLAALASTESVETSVSETQVANGEPIALRIRLRGAAGASHPDLAPLATDFEVLDVQRSQRTTLINGVSDSSIDWLVQILPRRTGELEIPALAVGDALTEPKRIEVSANAIAPAPRDADPGAAQTASAAPVLLEVHAERAQPYEHERVLVRVELLASADVTDGALGAPEVPGALIQPLGEERRIEKEIDGRRYRGIERSYTLLPEASGELEIPALRFEGRMRVPRPAARARGPRGSFGQAFFDDFFAQAPFDDELLESFFGGGSRAIVVESEPVRLSVRPRPDAAAGAWWLPARDVALNETWDPAAASVHVGEPLTRRIELRADGASPAQLPQLASGDVEGIKQYAEAPKSSETARGTLRVEQTTLIPTQPGRVTLPAVEVAWWDTQADAPRTAVLPERSVEVLPAAGSAGSPMLPAAGSAGSPAQAARVEASQAAAAPATPNAGPAAAPSATAEELDLRRLVAALAFALGATSLLGVVVVLRRRRGACAQPLAPTRRSAERALRRACKRNDPAAAEAALRALGRALAPQAASGQGTRWAESLGAPALAREIAGLQALRYLSQAEAWDGSGLWQAWRRARNSRQWRRARKTRRPRRARHALPPLYPAPESPRG